VSSVPVDVLVLATYIGRDQAGAAQATLAVINALAESTWARVTLFAYRADRSMLSPAVNVVLGTEPPSRRFLWRIDSLLAVADTRRALATVHFPRRPQFVYTQNTAMGLAWRELHGDTPLASHTGAVITAREVLEEDVGRPAIYRRLAAAAVDRQERRSYASPRWVHIVSTRLVADQRERHFGLPSGFFTVLPYGVDQRRFDPDAAHPDMRATLGIPRDAVLVASVARLVSWKHIDWVIDAVARLGPSVHLVVVGDGPAAPGLRARAEGSGAHARIHFAGHTDPAPWLAASDVFVLPSAIESFGMVYAEAMLMGLPCIGRRNDPPRVLSSAQDVIPEGKAGYCVSSVDELYARLDALAGDAQTRRRLGAFGSDLARREYSTAHYLDGLRRIMREDFQLATGSGAGT
jgi:glycosyltransferase involved in cell wall biosynthesis